MKNLIIIRSGGDIASGTIQKLHRCGFKVLVLEIEKPSAIRREVAFGEAVYRGKITIEGDTSVLCKDISEIENAWNNNHIPVVIDPSGEYIKKLSPIAVVDGILAKKNCGTTIDMAPIVIGLGPGFEAKKDVHIVIETMRGHDLGRLIFDGVSMPNTGIPGIIKGVGKERVIYSPVAGNVVAIKKIGDIVKKDEIIAKINDIEILSPISGVLRGIIPNGYLVPEKFKIADVDPREEEQKNCFTISDKARTIGGSVLEGILYLLNQKGELKWKD